MILCAALASPSPSPPKCGGWVVCRASHTLSKPGCHSSSQGSAPGGSAEMLQGPGEGKLSVPRLPSLQGERLNGKVVSEGLLKCLVQL